MISPKLEYLKIFPILLIFPIFGILQGGGNSAPHLRAVGENSGLADKTQVQELWPTKGSGVP